MTDAFFILTAWAVGLIVLGAYVTLVISRGKALSRKVPVEPVSYTHLTLPTTPYV